MYYYFVVRPVGELDAEFEVMSTAYPNLAFDPLYDLIGDECDTIQPVLTRALNRRYKNKDCEYTMWVDEECKPCVDENGKLQDFNINYPATELCGRSLIGGTVVITRNRNCDTFNENQKNEFLRRFKKFFAERLL